MGTIMDCNAFFQACFFLLFHVNLSQMALASRSTLHMHTTDLKPGSWNISFHSTYFPNFSIKNISMRESITMKCVRNYMKKIFNKKVFGSVNLLFFNNFWQNLFIASNSVNQNTDPHFSVNDCGAIMRIRNVKPVTNLGHKP